MYVTDDNRTFVKAYHDVLSSTQINPTDKLVYLTLLSYQEAGLQVFPSNDHIAKSLGLSKSTVIRSTGALEKAGLITKTRRFNNSNLVTVNSVEVSKCNVQRCQSATSRGVKVNSYKNTDKNRNKISLEEGQIQNTEASLSQGMNEIKIHCDENASDFNLFKNDSEQISVNKEEVTETYASMHPAYLPEDDEPLDHDDDDLAYSSSDEKEDSLPEFEYDDLSKPVYFDEDAAEKAFDEKSLFKSGLGRVTPTSRQKERAKYNRSQSHRSNPNY